MNKTRSPCVYSDTPARLAACDPQEIEGRIWWRYQDICSALRIGDASSKYIEPNYKRRQYLYGRGYRSRVILLVCLEGVEQLVIRYSRTPRHVAMSALQSSVEALYSGVT